MDDLVFPAAPTVAAALDAVEDAALSRLHALLHPKDADEIVLGDALGFFALRLAVAAASQETESPLSTWWISVETTIFRQRLSARLASLQSEVAQLELVAALAPSTYAIVDGAYVVPFYDVPQLVRHRSVVVHAGTCRLAPLSRGMVSLLARHRERQLEADMATQLRAVGFLDLTQLEPLVAQVRSFHAAVAAAASSSPERRRLTSAKDVAAAPLPLCMATLYSKLTTAHHLKYDGRNQLRLFLKGAGFSFAENYAFWKDQFRPKTTAAVFEKKYAYNIRHGYGLVGSRIDYSPMDCATIQNGPAPRPGQYHGCPFKHWERGLLEATLRTTLPVMTATAIADQASVKQYGRACGMHLEALASAKKSRVAPAAGLIITHPNVWLDKALASVDKDRAT
ncbi:DNA primase [Achlya hypogyna]|uniref:DNA primase n=1 Tax=Achlya hypogyna TaxID=1202772 RepID=A0A1V9Z329_ACHHY|nr:DNA primase [Achlya hypogyna]